MAEFMEYEVINMRDRIVKIMEREQMGQAQFANAIGIQRAAMSHIISGRNNPSLDVMLKILNRYPQLNPDWLLLGKGDMLREDGFSADHLENSVKNPPQIQLMQGNNSDASPVVSRPENDPSEKQMVVSVEKTAKTVSKIMVFYSDNTYDTFVPEKTDDE